MGIRFYCPNGHKLNIKEKLAGKRGICPQCGVKLLIPLKSTRPSSREERENQQRLTANANGNPNNFDVFTDDQGTSEIAISFDESGNLTAAFASEPGPNLATAFDDPGVIWYVQLSDGQRFGPATLAIMQSWVRERRIGPHMLVWREGWQDWIEARHVFPEIDQIFDDWKSKKHRPVSQPPQQDRISDLNFDDEEEDEPQTSRSIVLMISVISVVAIVGIILYFLLKS